MGLGRLCRLNDANQMSMIINITANPDDPSSVLQYISSYATKAHFLKVTND